MSHNSGASTSTNGIYRGTNTDLRENPCCHSCARESSTSSSSTSSLFRCSRCRLVWYCGADCQKRDYPEHKKTCRAIEKLQKDMVREAECLKTCQTYGRPGPENLFESAVGRFWDIFETRGYIRARMDLSRKQEELAKQVQTREAWTAVLDHQLACLRLCQLDITRVRYAVPFLLLRVNRDDDAFCFCLDWLKQDAAREYDRNDHSRTKEGDWIYPREENCRFHDLFHEMRPHNLDGEFDVAFVLGIAIIKMRLVAVYDHRMKEFESFLSTPRSKLLGVDELSKVRSSIMGSAEEEEQFADQRRQLNALLDALQGRNVSVVPALLHPDPLLKQPSLRYFSKGLPSEALMIVNFAIDMWRQIPGADAFLEPRFGTSTPYYPAIVES